MIISGKSENASPILNEALRYMGYKKNQPLDDVMPVINECLNEISAVIKPICCYDYADLKFISENQIDIGFGTVTSKSLTNHLKGCNKVILFSATIGIGVDRLITKYGRLNRTKSLIIDALGSSAVESWCDFAEDQITNGVKHCSRFSAGYGDFSLEHQKDFVKILNMNKNMGITLSESLLMTPTKSVTAVIGLGAENRTCGNKCASCNNKSNCKFALE